jgi:integrase
MFGSAARKSKELGRLPKSSKGFRTMSDTKSKRVPSYCKHKPSGQSKVVLNGKTFYLGRYGSAASKQAYDRLIHEWLAAGRQLPGRTELTVNQLILTFLRYAEGYYRKPDGRPTNEVSCLKVAFRPLRELYGDTSANDFGPAELKTVREAMIGKGWYRKSINRHLERIRRMYRWAGGEGLVPAECYHRLLCVGGLKIGRTEAVEGKPIRPVPIVYVEAVRPHVSAPIRAMIDLQLLTAMRPGEACVMRACDLETSGRVWIYRPQSHKTQYFGHVREIYLGPRAQEVVKPFLKTDLQAFLFSPHEAREEHYQEIRAARKTRVQPSQECRREANPVVLPGDHYTPHSYRRAISYACGLAWPLPAHLAPMVTETGKRETRAYWKARLTADEKAAIKTWRREHSWHPHQLRHNAATSVRKEYGIELARIILGHSTAFTTEIYAEQDRQQAVEVIAKIG